MLYSTKPASLIIAYKTPPFVTQDVGINTTFLPKPTSIMRLFEFAPTLLIWPSASSAFAQNPLSSEATIFGSRGTITLTGNSTTPAVFLLDYGRNVEGFPTFEVVSASGKVDGFKIRYSETKAVLQSNPNVRPSHCAQRLIQELTSEDRAMALPVWQLPWTRTV